MTSCRALRMEGARADEGWPQETHCITQLCRLLLFLESFSIFKILVYFRVRSANDVDGDVSDEDDDDVTDSCVLRYQQSIVEVFTRFVVPDGRGTTLYLAHQ